MPRPAAGGAQRREAGSHLARIRRPAAGPPISTPRWPIPITPIYFDAQTTERRAECRAEGHRGRASTSIARSRRAVTWTPRWSFIMLAQKAGVKHGVVQDKLWLPGLLKLQTLTRSAASSAGSFPCAANSATGSSRATPVPAQRPSWNYRKEDGGGIIIDMLCHWRYVLDNLFGAVKRSPAWARPTFPQRWDEAGRPYDVHRRRFRLRHLPAGRRHRRALQLLLVRARAARRSADHPGGRHQGQRRRRPAPLLDAAYGSKRRARSGIRTSKARINYFDGWQKVPEQNSSTTPSRASGSFSCGTL